MSVRADLEISGDLVATNTTYRDALAAIPVRDVDPDAFTLAWFAA